jgi:hypothetical protein
MLMKLFNVVCMILWIIVENCIEYFVIIISLLGIIFDVFYQVYCDLMNK